MILVDANLLLYAKHASYPEHARAREWLDGHLNERPKVGLPWSSLLAFIRLSINPRVFPRPLSFEAAWLQVTAWLEQPCAWIPSPTEDHARVFERLTAGAGLTSALVTDAHLAALSVEHGLTLCSADGDFARFRELKWVNPLAD